MITLPGPRAWKVGFVGRRLRELGQHLTDLSRRVRETVAEAVRDTVAQMARCAVERALSRRSPGPIVQEQSYGAEGEFDSWADEEAPGPWIEPGAMRAVHATPEVPPDVSGIPVVRSSLALALAAAGWWLGRQGSWWGALAVGLVAGAAAAVTRRLTGDGLLLVQAAHGFLSYRQASATPTNL
jgi:hypothetical protein